MTLLSGFVFKPRETSACTNWLYNADYSEMLSLPTAMGSDRRDKVHRHVLAVPSIMQCCRSISGPGRRRKAAPPWGIPHALVIWCLRNKSCAAGKETCWSNSLLKPDLLPQSVLSADKMSLIRSTTVAQLSLLYGQRWKLCRSDGI